MTDFKFFCSVPRKCERATTFYLKKPEIIGLVETDKEAQLNCDSHAIRYFKVPKAQDYPLDLNAGSLYEYRSDYKFKYKLNKVSEYLMAQHIEVETEPAESLIGEGEPLQDVIAHRGALTVLLLAPLQIGIPVKYEWTIFVSYFNNKLYLCRPGDNDGVRQTYFCRFVQYCFTDDPRNDPDPSAPIHENEQMYCIYRSRLKNFNLLYSAEINGIISDQKLQNVRNFQELNQKRFVHTKLMKKNIRNWRQNYRIKNWWGKSYFSAVNDIYVGLRDDAGFVDDRVEHVVLHELVNKQKWSPKVCLQFLDSILTSIHAKVKNVSCPFTTYEFHFDSTRASVEYKRHVGRTDNTFLTDEYIEHEMKNSI